jgi:hypothetical protein
MTSNGLQAKRQFMTSFFDNLDEKVTFLEQLFEQERKDEARMLCVCYLDGLSNWLHQTSMFLSKNFAVELSTHSGNANFSLLMPEWLLSSLPWGNAHRGWVPQIKTALRTLPAREAILPHELVRQVAPAITHDQLNWLKDEMWRGSVAKAVYDRIRSPNVHWLGSADGLVFDGYTYLGRPLPRVDFPMLHQALKKLAVHARSISMSTDKWFGII